jgi:hypothetical protein
MYAGFDHCGMIAIFPVCSLAMLSSIVLLPRVARYQLHGRRDIVLAPGIFHQKMDMIGSDRIIQDCNSKPLSGLIQPVNVTLTITGKLQNELLLMATVRQMPYVPWYVMSICPRHGCSAMNLLLLFMVIARMPMASISLLKIDP